MKRFRGFVQKLLGKFDYKVIRIYNGKKLSSEFEDLGNLTDYHAYYYGVDFLCPSDSVLGQWVLSGKTWDPNLTKMIERLSRGRKDFVICEVGSNIGASIVPVMTYFPNYYYILIEASPRFIRYLYYNTRSFAKEKLQVHNVLLSDVMGDCETLVENRTTAGRARHGPFGITREYRLDTMTLDELIGDGWVDFLKVDTDGFEFPVLRGAESLISRCRPSLLVEFTPSFLHEGGEDPQQFLEWVVSLGYPRLEVYDNLGTPLGVLSPEETLCVAESRPNNADYVDILFTPDR